MRWWHWAITGLVVGIAGLASRSRSIAATLQAALPKASSTFAAGLGSHAAGGASGEHVDSLPDVPGLRDREQKEPGFIAKLLDVINSTGANGDRLAAIMSEESGFNPQARNSLNATGLLQWMPKWSKAIAGYTVDELFAMTATEQLDAVKNMILHTPGERTDPAMQGWGSHLNAPDDEVIATQGDAAYGPNAIYDKAKKGTITAGDVRRAVYGRLDDAAKKPRIGADGKAVA